MKTTNARPAETANTFVAFVRRTLGGAGPKHAVELILDDRDELPNRWSSSGAAYEMPALGWRYG